MHARAALGGTYGFLYFLWPANSCFPNATHRIWQFAEECAALSRGFTYRVARVQRSDARGIFRRTVAVYNVRISIYGISYVLFPVTMYICIYMYDGPKFWEKKTPPPLPPPGNPENFYQLPTAASEPKGILEISSGYILMENSSVFKEIRRRAATENINLASEKN